MYQRIFFLNDSREKGGYFLQIIRAHSVSLMKYKNVRNLNVGSWLVDLLGGSGNGFLSHSSEIGGGGAFFLPRPRAILEVGDGLAYLLFFHECIVPRLFGGGGGSVKLV